MQASIPCKERRENGRVIMKCRGEVWGGSGKVQALGLIQSASVMHYMYMCIHCTFKYVHAYYMNMHIYVYWLRLKVRLYCYTLNQWSFIVIFEG